MSTSTTRGEAPAAGSTPIQPVSRRLQHICSMRPASLHLHLRLRPTFAITKLKNPVHLDSTALPHHHAAPCCEIVSCCTCVVCPLTACRTLGCPEGQTDQSACEAPPQVYSGLAQTHHLYKWRSQQFHVYVWIHIQSVQ